MEKWDDFKKLVNLMSDSELSDEEVLRIILDFLEDEFGPDMLERVVCGRKK
jgi:hypothetical protein